MPYARACDAVPAAARRVQRRFPMKISAQRTPHLCPCPGRARRPPAQRGHEQLHRRRRRGVRDGFERLVDANSRQMVREAGRFSASTPSAMRPSGPSPWLALRHPRSPRRRRRDPGSKIDGVSPKTALAVGLKVDVKALPGDLSTRRGAARSTSTIRRPRWRCSS